MRYLYLIILLFSFSVAKADSSTLVIGQKQIPLAECQITILQGSSTDILRVVSELQKYIFEITGTKLRIVVGQAASDLKGFVIISDEGQPGHPGSARPDPDGFNIRSDGENVIITGGSHKGTLYGVYELLERYMGCRFWAPGEETVPKSNKIIIPEGNISENPAFGSREVYYAGMEDPGFTNKMRCDNHAWKGNGDWGLWVHTMFKLVPPEKYFASHPEYYSLMAGKRSATQFCLTNPEVLRITIHSLDSLMKLKPEAKYWSVSQMDTYGNCECPQCKAINDHEGSPSGSLIEFVNKVAVAFPDKVISTLAYQYTRKAPAYVKPASNVNIMLCTIECDRNKPLESDTSTGSFASDMRNWSQITNNILVWDYVIQFSSMISPFPNLHVLQPNVKMFKKFHATSVFEQGCHGTYSENQELRQYILAKLLWNPEINYDSLVNGFLSGYYGAAGTWLGKYIDAMTRSLVASGKPLWIYGTPVEETGSFLTPALMKQYGNYFTEAEKAVEKDSLLLRRVKRAKLPFLYASVEIARKNITGTDGFLEKIDGKWITKSSFMQLLMDFVNSANHSGVTSIHERGLLPDKYKEDVERSILTAWSEHLALNKPYTLKNPPAAKYLADGPGSLTDGKKGFENFHILWQGFEGDNFEIVIDLGAPVQFHYINARFLQDITSWIFLPEYVEFFVSADQKKFTRIARIDNKSIDRTTLPLIHEFVPAISMQKARYIRVFAKNRGICPEWHIGHGGKAWLFADEIEVNRK
ncbi:MAG: DUF4838 domain-containing protein [Bacteroidetes bacterium]|nr:DUF4838 domain-containing protein [Bacteroidota bacterium]